MCRFMHASLAAAGLIGLAGLAAPAFADPMLYVDNVATNPPLGSADTVILQGTVDRTPVGPETEYAVEVVLTVNPGTSANPSTEYTLPTWCVDIFHDIVVPSSGETYSVGSLTTDNSLNPTALTSTQIQEIGDLVNYGDNLMQTSPSALAAAEVQSAIWFVEYNGGINGNNTLTVSSSNFTSGDINNTITAAEVVRRHCRSVDVAGGHPGAGLRRASSADRQWPSRRSGRRRLIIRCPALGAQQKVVCREPPPLSRLDDTTVAGLGFRPDDPAVRARPGIFLIRRA